MKIHLEKGANPFVPVGPLYSTCSKNGNLIACPDYKEFINRIKGYTVCMHEVITGYLPLDDKRFLLCLAGEDEAPRDVIGGLFSVLEDSTGENLALESMPVDLYERLNLEEDQDILFSMYDSEVVSEDTISVPIVIVETCYDDEMEWFADVLETDEKILIKIPNNIVPFEWKEDTV